MNHHHIGRPGTLVASVLAGISLHAAPLDTAFTYQGRLDAHNRPAANGVYGFRFTLHDSPGGSFAAGTNLLAVPVTNGLFAASLDFGAPAFAGEARWLEIGINTNPAPAIPSYQTLSPRVRVTPAPQALYALKAGSAAMVSTGAVAAGGLATPGAPASGQVLGFDGSSLIWQSPASLANAWGLTGNSPAPGSFLGTLNNLPLELRANNTRALRLEPHPTSPNLVGGWAGNTVDAGVSGAIIAGGGAAVQFGLSASNRITDHFGTIAGGAHNVAGNTNGSPADAYYATVGGGHFNLAAGIASTIAGGAENRAANNNSSIGGGYQNSASGYISTISGGTLNTNHGDYGVIGGGFRNSVLLNGDTVGGGYFNLARGSSSTVGGGYQNTAEGGAATVAGGSHIVASGAGAAAAGGENILVSGDYAAVGGGSANTADGYGSVVGGGAANLASGRFATTPGGLENFAAADASFAAGSTAQALHRGSFVWADSQSTPPPLPTGIPFASEAADEFAVRARGGARFQTTFLKVTGAGNELAYLGGDGAGNEVHLGSLNPTTTTVALYNQTLGQYMHLNLKSCTIYGGADLAEPFHMSTPAISQGSVVVIDPANPGKLKLSTQAYDKRVAGIVSGANGVQPGIALQQQGILEGGQNVALSGRVYVQADATAGAIEPGDLLTTSDIPGHAMKVGDSARAQGAILGKSMSSMAGGRGMILVLVTLQ